MSKVLKVGVVGVGRIGRLHIDNLLHLVPNAEIVSIADAYMNDDIIEWAKSRGIADCYDDAEKIFTDDSIEAVLICSTTGTHADYIMRCAQTGKHCFCEKPIDFDIAKIRKALAEVEKAGIKLQMGFVRRFDHNHKKVRDTVKSGMLGAPHIIKVTSRDPFCQPIEYVTSSGGLFMDMMIHDLDIARYLAGSDVVELSAYGTVLIDEQLKGLDDIDTAIVMLKFENGALGVIDCSRQAVYGYDQRTEVHCADGCVRVDNDLNDTSMIYMKDRVIGEKPLVFFLERYNNAFAAELVSFANAVMNDEPMLANGDDGLKSALLAKAAKISLDEKRPVLLSELQ